MNAFSETFYANDLSKVPKMVLENKEKFQFKEIKIEEKVSSEYSGITEDKTVAQSYPKYELLPSISKTAMKLADVPMNVQEDSEKYGFSSIIGKIGEQIKVISTSDEEEAKANDAKYQVIYGERQMASSEEQVPSEVLSNKEKHLYSKSAELSKVPLGNTEDEELARKYPYYKSGEAKETGELLVLGCECEDEMGCMNENGECEGEENCTGTWKDEKFLTIDDVIDSLKNYPIEFGEVLAWLEEKAIEDGFLDENGQADIRAWLNAPPNEDPTKRLDIANDPNLAFVKEVLDKFHMYLVDPNAEGFTANRLNLRPYKWVLDKDENAKDYVWSRSVNRDDLRSHWLKLPETEVFQVSAYDEEEDVEKLKEQGVSLKEYGQGMDGLFNYIDSLSPIEASDFIKYFYSDNLEMRVVRETPLESDLLKEMLASGELDITEIKPHHIISYGQEEWLIEYITSGGSAIYGTEIANFYFGTVPSNTKEENIARASYENIKQIAHDYGSWTLPETLDEAKGIWYEQPVEAGKHYKKDVTTNPPTFSVQGLNQAASILSYRGQNNTGSGIKPEILAIMDEMPEPQIYMRFIEVDRSAPDTEYMEWIQEFGITGDTAASAPEHSVLWFKFVPMFTELTNFTIQRFEYRMKTPYYRWLANTPKTIPTWDYYDVEMTHSWQVPSYRYSSVEDVMGYTWNIPQYAYYENEPIYRYTWEMSETSMSNQGKGSLLQSQTLSRSLGEEETSTAIPAPLDYNDTVHTTEHPELPETFELPNTAEKIEELSTVGLVLLALSVYLQYRKKKAKV